MSQAEQFLREGQLDAALTALQNQVKAEPANVKHRVFLFQLLSVIGNWERALTQLNVSGELAAANLAMVQTYREAIRCELLREKIFNGETSPLVFGEPSQWIALLIEACKLSSQGNYTQAGELREQAYALAPSTEGTFNGTSFGWIADSDSRLGPVVEAIVNGRYYWIPFERISRIQIEAPVDLRDLVWLPAQFTWSNGGSAFGLMPSRYPGSAQVDDSAIRLARKTEWIEPAVGHFHGLGQRTFVSDTGDYSLFDARELVFNNPVQISHG